MVDVNGPLFVALQAQRLAKAFLLFAQEEVRSVSIERSLRTLVLAPGLTAVETPYYWALYYHDGRGPIRARPGHKLVYFRDPALDPRIPNKRYPVRATDIRRLSRAQFYRFLRNPLSGMVVRDSVGPAAGDPFFTRAGRRFKRVAGRSVSRDFSAYVRAVMGPLMDVRVRSRITI